MGMKERFTADEWGMLKALPFAVFGAVASMDGKIDKREVREFSSRLQRAVGYKDALHRELMVEVVVSDVPQLLAQAGGLDPEKIRAFLQEKLTVDEYQSFMGSVFIDAMAVARASGGMFSRGKIGDREGKALQALAVMFGIDLVKVQQIFS